jgi:hypothetical protein
MYFVMALHRTVGDHDALSAVWPGHLVATCHRFLVEAWLGAIAGQLWLIDSEDILTLGFAQ